MLITPKFNRIDAVRTRVTGQGAGGAVYSVGSVGVCEGDIVVLLACGVTRVHCLELPRTTLAPQSSGYTCPQRFAAAGVESIKRLPPQQT